LYEYYRAHILINFGGNATKVTVVFSGDFGLGGGTTTIDATVTPEFKYSVTGTFDNATKVLNFEGDRITS
jgi:hypothetical protein